MGSPPHNAIPHEQNGDLGAFPELRAFKAFPLDMKCQERNRLVLFRFLPEVADPLVCTRSRIKSWFKSGLALYFLF